MTEAVYREVLRSHWPNTGRELWNLTHQETVLLLNMLLATAHEVHRGATPPPEGHNKKAWLYIPPTYPVDPALWREWDGDSWQDMSVGPEGRGFEPRDEWVAGTQYYVDDIINYGGGTYRVKVDHIASAGSPPADNATYKLWAAPGATGGAHAESHVSGADQIATATDSSRGLMDATLFNKLAGIEANATGDMTPEEILAALVTVDGPGQGINADLLDDLQGSAYEKTSHQGSAYEKTSQKGAANGYASLGSDSKVPSSQLPPAPESGYTPPWVRTGTNVLYAAWADGNPIRADELLASDGTSPTRSQIAGSIARLVSFRLPRDLSVTKVLLWGTGTQTGVYGVAIYRASDGARLWQVNPFDVVAGSWAQLTANLPLTLLANTKYFFGLMASGSGSNNQIRCGPAPLGADYYRDDRAPFAGRDIGIATAVQATMSATATFDATLPALAAYSLSGGPPLAFLEGTAS